MLNQSRLKILSIDGGGIKGIFPAKFLALIEEEIGEGQIHKHFDLISGTSTGGIIALALSLGIPAKRILKLYKDNADIIFGQKRYNIFKHSFYSNKPLEKLLKEIFKEFHTEDKDPRIADAKTKLLIPIYSLMDGSTQVLKTPHDSGLFMDKHIPMYMAAMATSAAPTFFNSYSNSFKKIDSSSYENFTNKVDGGVYANNPSMIALIEGQTRLKKELSEIDLLSIGTGQKIFSNAKKKKQWQVAYWVWKKRIIELFMQSQSQIVHNSISVLSNFNADFNYNRIDLKFDDSFKIAMDETDKSKLETLAEKASREYQKKCSDVLDTYFSNR
jgi:patatin-like phospholipase/acyl hydrolase